jgi:hypothetical protein
MELHMSRISVQVDRLVDEGSILPATASAAPEPDRDRANRGKGDHGWRAMGPALALISNWMLTLAALLLAASGAQAQAVFATPQAVGSAAAEQSVTVTSSGGGAVGTVKVLTMGVAGADFAAGAGASNCASATLAAGGNCTEWVTFTPAAPGLRLGAVILLDSGGNLLGTTLLSGTGSGGLAVLVPGNIVTVAGVYGAWTSTRDGFLAITANLDLPASVALDGAGNLYIADSAHNRVRMVAAATGLISTIAGSGSVGYTGENVAASTATLNTPSGVALDGAGNLYIADSGNNVVRKVALAAELGSAGIITTVAGNGTAGLGGDGGPATAANLDQPLGVTLDSSGNLYISDTANQRIREVDATGNITTLAGTGAVIASGGVLGAYGGDSGAANAANLNNPYAVAFDALGNMYIPDSANNRIRMVKATAGVVTGSSIISTFAGTGAAGYAGDNAAANRAELYVPSSVAFDAAGNLYIADTQNSAIRKVTSTSSSTPGVISTLAVNGIGYTLNSGDVLAPVSIYAPMGLALDGNGDVFFADYLSMLIAEVESNVSVLNYTATAVRQGDQSTTLPQTVENDGNAPLDMTGFTPDANAALDPIVTTCTTGTPPLAVDADCTLGAIFAPSASLVFAAGVSSEPVTGNIDIADDIVSGLVAPNSPQDIELVGVALAVNSTTITLTSSNNPSQFGQSVTFTATVTTGASTGNLTGTVTFMDGATTLASNIALNSLGTEVIASFSTSLLTVGTHSISATYNNTSDPNHLSSTSAVLSQVVQAATAISLTSSANPSALGANVTFTAKVTTPGGGSLTPDGTVIFTDTTTGTILGSPALGTNGIATVSTATMTIGLHDITATYSGDAAKNILGISSPVLKQDVQAPSSTGVTSTPNPSILGNPVTFTVTVTPSESTAAGGTVQVLDGGVEIGTAVLAGTTNAGTFTTSSLSVGSHTITAAYQGDPDYASSTSTAITQVVKQAQTSTTLVASPNPGIAGKGVTLTAAVQVIVGVATPTGTVTFTDTTASGTATLGSASLGLAGMATISPTLAPGTHSIVATYAGDANDDGSASAAFPLTVVLATTQTVVASTPNPALVLATITFTATVTGNGGTPTGSVNFLAGATSMGAANLVASGTPGTATATFTDSGLPAGSYQITASYAGDTNDSPSTSAAMTQTVGTIPTVTDLGSAATTGSNPQVILVATVIGNSGPTPTGTITFKNGTAAIGTATLDSSGVATLTPALAAGQYSIVAVYSGDTVHSPSTSQPTTIIVPAADFDLTVTPAAVSLAAGQNITLTVTLTSNGGFADTIGLGCGSLPAAVTCHFASISANLAANGRSTVQLTIDTNNPLSGGTVAANTRPGNRGVSMAGLLAPLSVLFGFIFWRFRKRRSLALIAVLVLSSATLLVTGCGGFTQSKAAAGSYVIQVNGVGANSDVSRYQNVTLTITN